MVHLVVGMLRGSYFIRGKGWTHKTNIFDLHNRWHFRCLWDSRRVNSFHRSRLQVGKWIHLFTI